MDDIPIFIEIRSKMIHETSNERHEFKCNIQLHKICRRVTFSISLALEINGIDAVAAVVNGVTAVFNGVIALVNGVTALVNGFTALVNGVTAISDVVAAVFNGVIAVFNGVAFKEI
jgi:hypothetical protein